MGVPVLDDREVAVVDHPVFDHEGPWDEDAYLALSHDGRVEVIDGTLLVGPGATEQRARVVAAVGDALQAAVPSTLRVLGPVSLRLGRDCVLVPDLVVTAAPPEGASEEEPDRVIDDSAALMVIEVVGSDHGAVDRVFKPELYARSRIPYSVLIDYDAPFAVAHMIINGRYHEYARATGGERLRIDEPFPMEIDIAAAAARPVTETPAAG